jgi:hypothetical protein
LDQAMVHIGQRMEIPVPRWTRASAIVRDFMQQRRIDDYS